MVSLVLATLLMGGFAVVVRFGQRRGGDAVTIGAVNYVVAAACFVPFFSPFPAPAAGRGTLAIGVVGGLSYATAYFIMLPVLKHHGVAIASAAMRLSVVIPMLLSLLLWQETPTTLQAIGSILALAALPLLAIGRPAGPFQRSDGLAPLLVAALFLANGGCGSVGKWYHVAGRAQERPVFFATLFAVAALYAGLVWLAGPRRLARGDLGVGGVLGVVNAGANLALLSAFDAFSGVVVFPVTAAGGLVFAVMFAAVAWKEWPNRWGMAGVVLAVVAVTVVNLSSAGGAKRQRPPLVPAPAEASPFGRPDRSDQLTPRTEGYHEEDKPMGPTADDLTALWDLHAIAAEPLRVEVLRESAHGWGANRVRTREVRYHSHDWPEGEVSIAAHLAFPAADAPVPAMVLGTGDADSAEEFAREHRVAAIAIDRPGTGESTGPEDDYSNWVRFTDPRESWMWHYVNAALRAVTLATTLSEVDPERIGITGSSRGGTMAWIANGVDPRLKLAVPIATGGDIVCALDHGNWANYLHRDEAGKPYIPDEFYTFAQYYDPILYAGRQHGAVMLIVGAQDEYFPLYCTGTSARASQEDDFRVLVIANWDHGYFTADNPQVDAFDNSPEAHRKQAKTVGAAIDAWLRGNGALPSLPKLTVTRTSAELSCSVPPGPGRTERVMVQASFDGAYTFEEVPTRREGDGYVAQVPVPDPEALEEAALFAEVEYAEGPVLTSLPWFGSAFHQRMRPFPEPEE